MNADQTHKLARRFIELSSDKRRLFLEGLKSEGVDFSLLPIPAQVAVEDRDALSYAQQRMWFLWQLDPQSSAYNLPMAVRLKGALNGVALQHAFDVLVVRHESLRSRFVQEGDTVRQLIADHTPLAIRVDDLESLSASERDAQVAAFAEAEAAAPFDLAQGPLLRVRLLKLAGDEHVLLLTLHHIIADGWSLNLLIDEFMRAYDAACEGREAALAPLPIQYRDYALWQRSWLEAGERERQLAYWQETLGDDHSPLDLPLDRQRTGHPSHQGARYSFEVEASLAEQLRTLARQHNVTLFVVLLAAFKLLLQRHSGQTAIRVGVPIANRNHADVEGLIGCFINTQVLYTEIDPLLDISQLLLRVKDTALGAQAHQDLPFEQLVEALGLDRGTGQTPLFQVLFNHQATVADVQALQTRSGLTMERVEPSRYTARFDLSLDTYERGGRLYAAFTYATDVFDTITVERLQAHWLLLLEQMAGADEGVVGEFWLSREMAEVAEVPVQRGDSCIHQLIEQAASQHPDELAAVSGDDAITYGRLEERARQVAQVLLAAGVQPDQRVGLVADRSVDMLVGMLGILKAGAAYLPLEPEQPQERLAFMLADSAVDIVLGRSSWAAELPADVRLLNLDGPMVCADETGQLPVSLSADNLAYVIYTSGTTGMPKGVAVSHGALVNYVQGVSQRLPMEAVSNLAMVSTPAADLGHTILFGALCAGKTLHLLDKNVVLDAEAFGVHMLAHQVDVLKIVPSHLEAMLAAGPSALPERCLILGGEACPPALLAKISRLAPELLVINHYGPTETTVGVLTAPLSSTPVLGNPLENVTAQVLDACLLPVPTAAKGELYISGAALARGYLGRPGLTAERFVPNPAGDGARMYRTGDWVHRNAAQELLFAGRMDGQVKIRGYRVELAEIESRLRSLPGIANALVRVFGDAQAKQLAAYLVPAETGQDQQAFTDGVRATLKRILPEHMVPAYLIALERFPVTVNGKVDVKALPEPVATSAIYEAPITELQIQLAAIWAEVLRVERVGLADNFFELGGHSLLATQVVSRARQRVGLDIPLRTLFDTADLQTFAQAVSGTGRETGADIELLDRDTPLPVSHAQHRQWLFWKLHPQSTAYNTPLAVRLRGHLDFQALQGALDALVARHESLRTIFREENGMPWQQILPASSVVIGVQDLRGQDEMSWTGALENEATATFDLANGPLLRVKLFQVDDDEHLLAVTLHHIVSDGWSMSVMVREFASAYNVLAAGGSLAVQPLPVQYADYAAWQRQRLVDGQLQAQLGYWKAKLEDDFDVLELPADRPRPQVQSYQGERIDVRLPADLTNGLRRLAVEANATLFHVFLAAFAILLSRYSGKDKINIGVPVTNRNRLELEGLIGFFVNTIVARIGVDYTLTFPQLLEAVKETTLEAQANKDLPFDALVEELKPERGLGHNPLFQVMYNHLRDFGEQVSAESLRGLHVEEIDLAERSAQFDITLGTLERTDGIIASFNYSSDLFDEARIKNLSQHWVNLLKDIVEAPGGRVSELNLLGQEELKKIIFEWNLIEKDCSSEQCIHQLIEAQAARTPNSIAVVFGDQELTYQQLNRSSNRVAYRLRELGVGPDVLVGILVERSLDMVVGLLGILKAGGGYVPLDPHQPQDRLAYMIEDSGAKLLLTQSHIYERLPITERLDILMLDYEWQWGDRCKETNPENIAQIENVAYVIYTSGSTGRPKGVAVPHSAISMHLAAVVDVYGFSGKEKVLQFASISFDAASEQIWEALSCGASIRVGDLARIDYSELNRIIDNEKITFLNLPPAHVLGYARYLCLEKSCNYFVSVCVVGGEAWGAGLLESLKVFPNAKIFNAYGPTEAVITPLVCEVDKKLRCKTIPIGRPVGSRSVYILSGDFSCQPVTVPGELLIAGEGLSRGYLSRPAQTAERFIPNPFDNSEHGGGRLYRTGDLTRYLDDGVIEYVGRIDHQVKIRGFRIELGEIEARLQEHSAIRETLVVDIDGPNGKQLVAYLVTDAGSVGDTELRTEVREHLKGSLPDYMVPAHLVFLEQMPLTPNGKLDRKALPKPDVSQLQQEYVAPQSELEQQIAEIWADVLKVEKVGLTDNFFELGGHSLLATQVISRMRQVLDREVSLRALFETSELGDFTKDIALNGVASQAPEFTQVRRDQPLALSYAQQRLWFLWQLEPESSAYNMPTALRLKGSLDIEALRSSFESLIARHEPLRTTFRQDDDQTIQVIHPGLPFEISVEMAKEQALEALVDTEAQCPFDLENGPLLRVKLMQLAEDDHVLVLTLHHIVSDAWSTPVMVDELIQLYDACRSGQPAQLPAMAIQYADYAVWQRSWMEAGEQERQMTYWKSQLGDVQPVLELPTDRPRPALQNHSGASVAIELDEILASALKRVAQQQGVTLFMVLLASFQTLLHRYSGQDDIRVGVPIANRNRVETERLIGFFVNTQVLKAEFNLDTTFSILLKQVQQTALAAQAHQDLPFEQLVEALHPERSLSHSPLFQVMYNHQSQARGESRTLPGLTVDALFTEQSNAKFDLTLDTYEHAKGIGASLCYATALFDEASIERLIRHWVNLLEGIVNAPEHLISSLPMLDNAESQHILAQWDQRTSVYPSDRYVHQLFEARAQQASDALAILFDDQRLTYGQLNSQANRLAHHLIELGVGPEVRVAIAMRRSAEIMVAFMAVLKAGGAYVPLDVAYPQDRLLYMMEDCAAALVLTQSDLLDILAIPVGLTTVLLDQRETWSAYPDTAPNVCIAEDNLAYVIYTSGSTGKPKGVAVSHGPLVAHIQALGELYETGPEDCELHFMSFAFDGSHEGWMHPLINGARVLVRDDSLWLPEHTYAQMRKHGVTMSVFPPIYLQQLAEHALLEGNPPSTRIYCFGGDAMPQASYELAWKALRPQYLFNGYGPTETVVTPLLWKAREGEPCGATYAPIGKLVGRRRSYILGYDLNLLPAGFAGELYLGGHGVARGYLERPGLTAERFVPDLFGDGERVYRSGDLTRARADGVVDYLGRIDYQVKIRGFRIELGEIEARLQEHEAVREAVVVDIEGPSGKQLVGYLVAEANQADDPEQQTLLRTSLRDHLKANLPDYMVPAHLVFLEQMPLTPNGKLDRKALPKPDTSQLQQEYVAPQSELEQQISAIWADVLKVEKVGLTDNFFELGGDSIISIQVVSRARQAGIRFTPKELFQHQTVQGLASVAKRGEAGALQIDQGPVTGAGLLLPIHQYFFDEAIPERHHWNQALLLKPGKALEPELFEQALQALIVHHDALRLSFEQNAAGRWSASYRSATGRQEVLWQSTVQSETELEALCNEAQSSLSLQDGPLVRAVFATLADGTQRLLLAIHHLAVDGVSWRILLEDLQTAYGQLQAKQAIKLPAKTSSTRAWAEHLQTYASSEALQQELGYWNDQLASINADLPCDNPEGSLQGRHAGGAQTRLDQRYTRQLLQEAPSAYRTQINDLLLTALARVISRWTQQDNVLVQLEGHGREELFDTVDLTRTVGWFTSMFPVKLSPSETLDGSIKQIKEQLRAIPNKGIGFGALRYLGDEASQHALAELPVPRITFNYLGQFDGSFEGEAEEAAFLAPANESSGASQNEEAPLGNWLSINGQVYGGELSLSWSFSQEMFDEATIQRLADEYAEELKALVEHCSNEATFVLTPSDVPLAKLNQEQLDALPINANEIEDIYPLSPMQQGMLFHSLFEQDGGDYINQVRVDVNGLNVELFRQAWQTVVDRHEVLRANFVTQFEQPLQVIRKRVEMPFVVLDWSTQADIVQSLDILAEADRHKSFDLQQDPLLRIAAIRTGENSYHLIYTNHHILMDGWSNSQLLGEVLQSYAGAPFAHQTSRYRDYIEWLQKQDKAQSEAFWRGQFGDLQEPTRLAQAIRQDKANLGEGYGDHYQVLDKKRTQALSEFARQQRVTVNTLVQAAWLLLLQRYTGQDTVSFGATVSGRPAELKGVEQQLGLFINTLPVIANPKPEQSVAQWIAQVQAQNLALREYEHTPLYEVQRWAGQGGEALFDNILVFENYPVSEALQQGAPSGLEFTGADSHEQTNYPLTLGVTLSGELSVHYSYDRKNFSDSAVEQIAKRLDNLLGAIAEQPQQYLGDLAMLSAEEHHQIVYDWNPVDSELPSGECIHRLIEQQAEKSSGAVAVIFGEQSLTYQQLNGKANQLAHKLRELGVGPDVLVGIAVERSLEMVVGLLGILKAGGAYVPLDPEYPQDRLSYMMEDSGITLLLTQAHLQDRLPVPSHVQSLHLDPDGEGLEGYSDANPANIAQPDNLAYVIYTSGSTGRPKGVAISHDALSQHAHVSLGFFNLSADDRILQFATFNFDGFVEQLYPALICGASVVIRGRDIWDSETFYQELLAKDISVVDVTTAYWFMLAKDFAEKGPRDYGRLHQFHSGGEAMPPEGVAAWKKAGLEHVRLLNTYGPTEATVTVSAHDCADYLSGEEPLPVLMPIGKVLPGRTIYLLDHFGKIVVNGAIGELTIGGELLARGYFNRPALTAERFTPNPFDNSEQGGGRLYRTGDLTRYLDDGVIEYVGRIDHQVKIRGFRIELGEIEARLQEHSDIRETLVVDIDGPNGKQLVAYLVADAEQLSEADLRATVREHLKGSLPDYMVPAHLLFLEQMPLTPNGKLDRKALPKPDTSQQQQEYVAPQSELEQQIAAIWADVLKVEKVGLTDNFFDLGGHSLLVISVLSRLQLSLGSKVEPSVLFQHPDLQGFCEVMRGETGSTFDEKLKRLDMFAEELEEV